MSYGICAITMGCPDAPFEGGARSVCLPLAHTKEEPLFIERDPTASHFGPGDPCVCLQDGCPVTSCPWCFGCGQIVAPPSSRYNTTARVFSRDRRWDRLSIFGLLTSTVAWEEARAQARRHDIMAVAGRGTTYEVRPCSILGDVFTEIVRAGRIVDRAGRGSAAAAVSMAMALVRVEKIKARLQHAGSVDTP